MQVSTGGQRWYLLVHISSLGCELGATFFGLLLRIVHLVVEHCVSSIEVIPGLQESQGYLDKLPGKSKT